MNKKIITVIVPIYNRERYLDKCINSVLDQDNVETEIILVDDGSTDSSPEICDRYSREYSNIKVIHTENHGLGHARNVGLDIANGEYIMFLDSDDRYAPGALSAMQKALEDNNADFVIGGFNTYSDNYVFKETYMVPRAYANKLIEINTFLNLMLEWSTSLLAISIPLKFSKKALWEGMRFREDIRTSEDDFILPVILQKSKSIFILDKIVYYQTHSEHSLVRSAPSMNLLNATASRLSSLDYIISMRRYDVALFRFGDGTRRLLNAKKLLKTKEAKSEIKRQYKGYCKYTKELAPHTNFKNRIRFFIFRTNFTLYGLIREFTVYFPKFN